MTLCGNELCSHQQCATMRRDKRRAEWRLNAAAPRMLAALQSIQSTYAFLESMTAGHEPQHTNTVKALAEIRSAISQATATGTDAPVCYVNSETDCDGELHTCENCGRTMCFSHSAQCSDYSGERVTYCAECAGRP